MIVKEYCIQVLIRYICVGMMVKDQVHYERDAAMCTPRRNKERQTASELADNRNPLGDYDYVPM